MHILSLFFYSLLYVICITDVRYNLVIPYRKIDSLEVNISTMEQFIFLLLSLTMKDPQRLYSSFKQTFIQLRTSYLNFEMDRDSKGSR
jgi:hypothetical protein